MTPIAWYDPSNGVVSTDRDSPLFTPLGQVWPLYPKGEWVGLTDEDYFAVLEKLQNLYHRPPIAIFAKAIEQTLKEKNT